MLFPQFLNSYLIRATIMFRRLLFKTKKLEKNYITNKEFFQLKIFLYFRRCILNHNRVQIIIIPEKCNYLNFIHGSLLSMRLKFLIKIGMQFDHYQ